MEKNQELALTQLRKSAEKLGCSTEVTFFVPNSWSHIMHNSLTNYISNS